MRRLLLLAAVLLTGCSNDYMEHSARQNLCVRRGAGWDYVSPRLHGDPRDRYDSFQCVHIDSIAPRDSVVLPQ